MWTLLLIACSGNTDDTGPGGLPSFRVNHPTQALTKNEEVTVRAFFSDGKGGEVDVTREARWESSDADVVSVDNGFIRALGRGSATVTCAWESYAATVEVDVSAFQATGRVFALRTPLAEVGMRVRQPGEVVGSIASTTGADDGMFVVDGLGVGNSTFTPELLDHAFDPPAITEAIQGSRDGMSFAVTNAPYPRVADAGEPNDAFDAAEPLVLGGALVRRTIFPEGDVDWYVVFGNPGEDVEVIVSNLSPQADTTLVVTDDDGTTVLAEGDDFINRDSHAVVAIPASGTLRFAVSPWAPSGVVGYLVAVHPYVDADGDGFSPVYDCDDSDATRTPFTLIAREWADGRDADCDGTIWLDPTVADRAERTDEGPTAARVLQVLDGSASEFIYRGPDINALQATLHTPDDVDWFALTIPPNRVYVFEGVDWLDDTGAFGFLPGPVVDIFEEDGATPVLNEVFLWAPATEARTVLFRVRRSAGPLTYWIAIADYGADADQDAYSTQDWDQYRDCDDSDPAITTECHVPTPGD